MLRYDLRLFAHGDPASAARRDAEQFEFDAEDDSAAVVHATSSYARELMQCHHAMLSSAGGRVIWRKHTAA